MAVKEIASCGELRGGANTANVSGVNSCANMFSFRQSVSAVSTQLGAASLEQNGAESKGRLQLRLLRPEDSLGRKLDAADITQIANKLFSRIEMDLGMACSDSKDKSLTKKQRSRADQDSKKLCKALNALKQEVKPVVYKQDSRSKALSLEGAARISLGFAKVETCLPSGPLKELTNLLAQHSKSAWVQMEKEKQQVPLLKEVSPLFEPGAGKVQSVSLELKGGASLLDVPGVGAEVGPYADLDFNTSWSKTISPDDEGACFENIGKTAGIGLRGGVKVKGVKGMDLKVEGQGKFQFTRNDFIEFSDPKDYVKKQGHKLIYADRLQYSGTSGVAQLKRRIKSKLPGNPGSELKQIKETQQQASNSQHRLNRLLISELGLDAKVTAPPPERVKPKKGYSHTYRARWQVMAAASNLAAADTGIKLGGAARLIREHTVSHIHKFTPTPISDVTAKDVTRINELPSNLTLHARELMNASLDSSVAVTALSSLAEDIDKYYKVVQKYDDLSSTRFGREKSNIGKDESALLKKQKHLLENKWGAVGRHQFLQIASASHAYLTSIAMSAKGEINSDVEKNLKILAAKIQRPEINYSKQRLDKIASFQQLSDRKTTDQITSVDISIGPFTGRLGVRERERVHPSRVREGRYWDITLTGRVAGSVQSLTSKAVFTAKLKEAAIKQGIELPGDLDISPDVGAGASISKTIRYFKPKYTQGPNYDGDRGYRRQFVRDTTSKSVQANLGFSGTIVPGAHAGANVRVHQDITLVKGETLGSNDLSYTMSRYNRMYKNSGKDPHNQEWTGFQQRHKAEYAKLFEHLGDRQQKVYKEAQYFLNELTCLKGITAEEKALAETFQKDFNHVMSDYRSDPGNEGHHKKASRFFNQFLEQQFSPWQELYNAGLKELSFDQGSSSGLNRGTRVAKSLGISHRVNEQAKVLPQQSTWYQTDDIDSAVTPRLNLDGSIVDKTRKLKHQEVDLLRKPVKRKKVKEQPGVQPLNPHRSIKVQPGKQSKTMPEKAHTVSVERVMLVESGSVSLEKPSLKKCTSLNSGDEMEGVEIFV